MEMKETIFHVNCSWNSRENVDRYWVSGPFSEDHQGYVGVTTDTTYSDSIDYTDWCVFAGTEEECKAFIASRN